MKNGFFLITGTSRGIGEALAHELLDAGHTVLGVSRRRSEALDSPRYHHHSADLTQMSAIDPVADRARKLVDRGKHGVLCLVNNAAVLEPLKSIERCTADEIDIHMRVGLIAAMLLTSAFIRVFADFQGRKKIAFVSSGAAFHAWPDSSMYCSAKAGLTMFARCVGAEQEGREHGFEIVSLSPGMVETSMQQTARSKTAEEFAGADWFREAFASGRVQERGDVVGKMVKVLERRYGQGEFVSLSEVE